MGKFTVGEIVLIKFPYSDLTNSKKRPALVIGLAEFGNVILCQITSSTFSSNISIEITERDITKGALPVTSYIRPDKIFTADTTIIAKKLGLLNPRKIVQVKTTLYSIFDI